MIDCPMCKGTGRIPGATVPESVRRPPLAVSVVGGICHCDGPPHQWDRTWCPIEGPVTGR